MVSRDAFVPLLQFLSANSATPRLKQSYPDTNMSNEYPKLHNAMWPGLVGKGSPGAEAAIDLDTMLDLTTKAEVNGAKFDGVDLFLFDPHVNIDSTDEDILRLAERIQSRGLVIGSVV